MGPPRRLLLVSNSTLRGGGYLGHCQQQVRSFFGQKVKRVLFIPYALHDRDAYAKTAREKFESLGYGLDSIHESSDPVEAVRKSEAIFIGGGNTFRLLKVLYDNSLLQEIRKRVLEDGIPYMGSSAGTNLATISINTTNDMPIVYPPSLQALGLVPFNINPHYLDPDVNSTHMGETRAERIRQYHEEPNTPPVLGLREGAMLLVEGDKATLQGVTGARLFLRGQFNLDWSILVFLIDQKQLALSQFNKTLNCISLSAHCLMGVVVQAPDSLLWLGSLEDNISHNEMQISLPELHGESWELHDYMHYGRCNPPKDHDLYERMRASVSY